MGLSAPQDFAPDLLRAGRGLRMGMIRGAGIIQ
jgi:hypothetical protein